jgi:ATP-dependent exoDNAse (exonuclease V) beta subunit
MAAINKSSGAWVQSLPQEFFDAMSDFILSSMSDSVTECVERLFAISERLLDKIEEEKRREGLIEFSDIEVLFLRLLSFEPVRTNLRDSIRYVFVDEFQDVSPIQLKIFQSLSKIVDENCWVGDPKQAIYGFRGSDTSLVNKVIASLKGSDEKLDISRRSLPQLVNASNDIFIRAFALLTASESLEEGNVRLKPWESKVAEEDMYGGNYHGLRHWMAEGTKAEDLYAAMASKLWNIFNEQKYPVTDTFSDKPELRNLKYGDVAILTRTGSECAAIANALRSKGLPVCVLDSKLGNQAEVKLVLALMKYIAGVDKKHTYAELRRLIKNEDLETILFGLAKQNDCSDLLQLLEVLRERYRYHSVYDMVKELIAVLDLRHLVCKWSMDQKRQTNLDVLVSMAVSFVQRKKEASVSEFISYLDDKEVEMPFDNTGNTIKVLTYHKSKGLQWKMVILNCLYKDYLEEKSFIEKNFSKLTTWTSSEGQVSFNLFPPVGKITKYIAGRVSGTEKAQELWEYLMEKKRAEELRLLYVGFTRAENYLVLLSLGGNTMKWLGNTNAVMSNDLLVERISDDSTLNASTSQTISVLPYDNVMTKVEGHKKYIVPSQCEVEPQAGAPICELETVAYNIDVTRWSIDADVFGTCIHKYMAVHRWSSDERYVETNVRNAGRVIDGFGLGELVAAENLVKQADAFFAYLEKKYGKIETIEHEIPFTRRKNGQVITGEIDLYVITESVRGILVDYKNPMTRKDTDDDDLKVKAIKYWPQLEAYRDALSESGCPVNNVYIYYPLLGVVAKF